MTFNAPLVALKSIYLAMCGLLLTAALLCLSDFTNRSQTRTTNCLETNADAASQDVVVPPYEIVVDNTNDRAEHQIEKNEYRDFDDEMRERQHFYRHKGLFVNPYSKNPDWGMIRVYRNGRLIVRQLQRYDPTWVACPLTNSRRKIVRSFDGDRSDFVSKKTKIGSNPFVDLNGDGIPDLVIVQGEGNAGRAYLAYSLGKRAKPLGKIYAIRSDAVFMDVDHDGKSEALAYDCSFFGWETCNAYSAMPFVILKMGKRRFELATSLMKATPPDQTRQKELLASWKQVSRDVPEGYISHYLVLQPVVWNDMLNLIYSGNSRLAFSLLKKFWPNDVYAKNLEYKEGCVFVLTSRKKFSRMLLEQLSTSPFLDEIKQLNRSDPRIQRLTHREGYFEGWERWRAEELPPAVVQTIPR